MSDRGRLSFELVERIALDEPLENEAQILGAELVPDVRIEEDERHVRIVGSLRFTAEYRTSPRDSEDVGGLSVAEGGSEDTPPPTRHLVYHIPLDISVPRERVTREGLLLEIRSLEVELLGPERLLLSTVLELDGIASSPEGEVVPVVDTGYSFESTGFWPVTDEPSEAKKGNPGSLGDDPALAALAYPSFDTESLLEKESPERLSDASSPASSSGSGFALQLSSEAPSSALSPQEEIPLVSSAQEDASPAFPSAGAQEVGEESGNAEVAEEEDEYSETGTAEDVSDGASATVESEQGRPLRKEEEQEKKEGEEVSEAARREGRERLRPKKDRSVFPSWGAPQVRGEHFGGSQRLKGSSEGKGESELEDAGEHIASPESLSFLESPRSGKGNFLPSQIVRSRGRQQKKDSALRYVYLERGMSAGEEGEIPRSKFSPREENPSERREGEGSGGEDR